MSLTVEPALEPALPICDAHHHLWESKRGFPYPRYLAEELLADIGRSGHNVRSTVYLEFAEKYRTSGPDVMRPVGEVEWVESLAGRHANGDFDEVDVAAAIVGYVDLMLGERVELALEAMKAASPNRFRGVRYSVRHQPLPGVFNRAERAGLLLDPALRAGARAIARMGLTLEGSLYYMQLPELVDLLRAAPDLTFIVNHLGGLLMIGPYAERHAEVSATWRRGVAAVAKCPNAIMKLGGVGTHFPRDLGLDWRTRAKPIGSEELARVIAPWMHYCIEHFGADRCMFESNFPGDKTSVSYNVLFNAFKRLSSAYSATERAALFHDTAVRVYRIGQ